VPLKKTLKFHTVDRNKLLDVAHQIYLILHKSCHWIYTGRNKDSMREEEALKLERLISPQYTAPISFSAGIYKPFCYYCRSSIKNFM